MNLKDRGITVGDLIIITIIILTAAISIKSFNKDKKTTLNQINQAIMSIEKSYYLKID
tara:strand:+ start:1757 stop:1930 length:174 start_codon:yes stop_codon:yes gene_type:complete